MYCLCSKNKGADQLCSYCEADLHLCFHPGKNLVSHDAAHIDETLTVLHSIHKESKSLGKRVESINWNNKVTPICCTIKDNSFDMQVQLENINNYAQYWFYDIFIIPCLSSYNLQYIQ